MSYLRIAAAGLRAFAVEHGTAALDELDAAHGDDPIFGLLDDLTFAEWRRAGCPGVFDHVQDWQWIGNRIDRRLLSDHIIDQLARRTEVRSQREDRRKRPPLTPRAVSAQWLNARHEFSVGFSRANRRQFVVNARNALQDAAPLP